MSSLTLYKDSNSSRPLGVFTDPDDIQRELKAVGVLFQRVDASIPLSEGADQEEVLSAYRHVVDQQCESFGYQSADVIRIKPDAPNVVELRQKFLSEHTHSDDEARVMVEGSGCFYLHLSDKIYQVVCTRGDLITVPAGVRHWFDMGPKPRFAAIRFFTRPEGWVAQFTGDGIADRFPKYEP